MELGRLRAGVGSAGGGATRVGLVLLAAMLSAIMLLNGRPDGPPETAAPAGRLAIDPPPRAEPSARADSGWADRAFFAGPTDTTLLVDTGTDGIMAVHLDARVAVNVTRHLQHSEPSPSDDQHLRLWRADDTVIAASGRVLAVPIPTAEARVLAVPGELGEATFAVPAAEPRHVWLIDDGHGRPGASATHRLVNLEGEVQIEVPAPDMDGARAIPRRGVRGGLAMETDDGVAIWDAASGEIVVRLGKGVGHVSDARGRTVVWCEGDCRRINVTNLESGHRSFPGLRPGVVFDSRAARLSPDGGVLAAIAIDGGPGDESLGAIVVVEIGSGELTVVTPWLQPVPASLAWSSDGRQLFFAGPATGAQRTDVGRYVPADGRVDLATLPVGGAHALVPLTRDEAGAFAAQHPPVIDPAAPDRAAADRPAADP